jgi:hypothetical protein
LDGFCAGAGCVASFRRFSTDPQWESFRNRLLPNPVPITRQDFGLRKMPGRESYEIAGWIQRSWTPAWFAKVIPRNGKGDIGQAGPIIQPDGKAHQWSIRYSPQVGQITVQLDNETRVLAVRPEHRKAGATFYRFGLFNIQVGGRFVDITVDDLTYTTKLR